MCGIFGIYDKNGVDRSNLSRSIDSMLHRGPDGGGIFISEDSKCGLGHRRLSVIDLTNDADQPMRFGSYWMVYNGEIYNYLELKSLLKTKGYSFTSNSDSEVLLKLFHCFGKKAFEKCIGMWAVAIYNCETSDLYLCRDRVGVKPLYLFQDNEKSIFSSDVRAIKKYLNDQVAIDQRSVQRFLQLGYVPNERSIYENVRKIRPGSFIHIKGSETLSEEVYWSPIASNENKHILHEEDYISELELIIKDSCNYRMVSDVPVGVFLSGGIDSSLVTALLSESFDLQTFTIGFKGGGKFDESLRAERISLALGTKHNHKNFCPRDLETNLVQALCSYDEPFGDSSAVPTFLLSKFASSEVKVALSADGGDEIFGGYDWYRSKTSTKLMKILQSSKSLSLDKYICQVSKLLADINNDKSPSPSLLNIQNKILRSIDIIEREQINQFGYGIKSLMDHDFFDYLPNDILTKTDRASMANSLEVREPLLDHRIIEFSYKYINNRYLNNSSPKNFLKKILYRKLPDISFAVPKRGFCIPLHQDQYKRVLIKFVDYYLSKSFVEKCNIVEHKNIGKIIRKWKATSEYSDKVWWLLSLHIWMEQNHFPR